MNAIRLSMLVCGLYWIISCTSQDKIDFSKLQQQKGIVYLKDSKKPFSGTAIEFYSNKNKKCEIKFYNGKPIHWIEWFENRKKKLEKRKYEWDDELSDYWNSMGREDANAILDSLYKEVTQILPILKFTKVDSNYSKISGDYIIWDLGPLPKGLGSKQYLRSFGKILDDYDVDIYFLDTLNNKTCCRHPRGIRVPDPLDAHFGEGSSNYESYATFNDIMEVRSIVIIQAEYCESAPFSTSEYYTWKLHTFVVDRASKKIIAYKKFLPQKLPEEYIKWGSSGIDVIIRSKQYKEIYAWVERLYDASGYSPPIPGILEEIE